MRLSTPPPRLLLSLLCLLFLICFLLHLSPSTIHYCVITTRMMIVVEMMVMHSAAGFLLTP